MRVKNDHRSEFSNLSKNQGFNGIRTRDLRVAGAGDGKRNILLGWPKENTKEINV